MKHETRESWLQAATRGMSTELFNGALPKRWRVSCSFPAKRATSARNRRLGECWDPSCSADGSIELFITPTLQDPVDVLATLAHEMVHAIVGLKAGHGGPFRKLATAIGLEGKMTATVPGEDLRGRLNGLAKELGPYPHAALTPDSGCKKQGTRLLKAECDACGYLVRLTRQWADRGLPTCCCGGAFYLSG